MKPRVCPASCALSRAGAGPRSRAQSPVRYELRSPGRRTPGRVCRWPGCRRGRSPAARPVSMCRVEVDRRAACVLQPTAGCPRTGVQPGAGLGTSLGRVPVDDPLRTLSQASQLKIRGAHEHAVVRDQRQSKSDRRRRDPAVAVVGLGRQRVPGLPAALAQLGADGDRPIRRAERSRAARRDVPGDGAADRPTPPEALHSAAP